MKVQLSLIFAGASLTFLVACGETTTTVVDQVTDSVPVVDTPAAVDPVPVNTGGLDWEALGNLKEQFVAALSAGEEPQDVALMGFLNQAQEVTYTINEALYGAFPEEQLNDLIYVDRAEVSPEVAALRDLMESSGYMLDQSEGSVFLSMSPTFLKAEVVDLLDAVPAQFLNMYCGELESRCCEDAGIMLEHGDLLSRFHSWGDLFDQAGGMAFEEETKSTYDGYFYLVAVGLDNTPAFDFSTHEFDPGLFAAMQQLVASAPDSRAGKELSDYMTLLEAEGMKESDAISQFIEERFQ